MSVADDTSRRTQENYRESGNTTAEKLLLKFLKNLSGSTGFVALEFDVLLASAILKLSVSSRGPRDYDDGGYVTHIKVKMGSKYGVISCPKTTWERGIIGWLEGRVAPRYCVTCSLIYRT